MGKKTLALLFAVLLLAAFAAGCTGKQCSSPADCEKLDLVHAMCVGEWQCQDGKCAWICLDASDEQQADPFDEIEQQMEKDLESNLESELANNLV